MALVVAGCENPGMLNSLRKMFSGPKPGYVRRWQRVLMSEPARITVGRGEVRPAILTQLSAGGARVQSSCRLRPGDMLRVDFSIGVAEHCSHTAVVVHSVKEERGFQWIAGLCFVEVEPQGDRRIAEFVEEEHRRRQIGFAMPRA